MAKLDLSSPETYLDDSVTIFREAMDAELAATVTEDATAILGREGWDLTQPINSRGFRPSRVYPIELSIPILSTIAKAVLPDDPLPGGTLRINWQDGGAKQGWHRDNTREPIVVYPVGEGQIDFAPHAKDIEQARAPKAAGEIDSVLIGEGDIALIHRGGEVFHRGRNLSNTDPRMTIVLH